MSPLDNVRILEFPKVCDPRGNLSFIEEAIHVPFAIKGYSTYMMCREEPRAAGMPTDATARF